MTLRFYSLGRFELYRHGQLVPRGEWGTHRAATLCKVLLTHSHQRLHKEQLQDWIWPDASPDAAARNLRVALSELRRILEPQRQPRDPSRYIASGSETLSLDVESVWIDSHVLRQTVDRPATSPDALRGALSLYQGPYLPDDLYAEWSQAERGSLALAYETGLLRLMEGYAQRQDFANALRVSRRALASHPTSEAFAERLMRYALELGETAMALRAYQDLQVALQTDLAVGPSLRVSELADAIRGGVAPPPVASGPPGPAREARGPAGAKPPLYGGVQQLEDALVRSATLVAELQAAMGRVRASRAHFNRQAEEARNAAAPPSV